MSNRKFFNKQIRSVTEEFHPNKLSLEEFLKDDIFDTRAFKKNMIDLSLQKEKRYIEEWMEIFLAWNEIEQENAN